jgi:hypothetical protein
MGILSCRMASCARRDGSAGGNKISGKPKKKQHRSVGRSKTKRGIKRSRCSYSSPDVATNEGWKLKRTHLVGGVDGDVAAGAEVGSCGTRGEG